MKVGKRFVAALLASATLLTVVAGPASASHRDRQAELERLIRIKQQQIREAAARERDLLGRIAASDRRRAVAQTALDRVESRLALARARLRAIEERLDALAVQLRVNTARLDRTLGLLHEKTLVFNERVQQMYIATPNGIVALIQASRDFEDYAVVDQYLSSVAAADMKALQALEAVKAQVQAQRAAIERKERSVRNERAAAAAETRRIVAIHADRMRARNSVLREITYKRGLLRSVRAQKATYQRALSSYQAESRSISAFLRGAQAGQQVIQGRGGWLKWPVSGRITSSYGWRTHPVYGYRSFHTGIDIGAAWGTTVKSARHGTVLYTGYRGAYGNVVIIDHGDSVATLYAHLSRFYVRPGERVDTLESIAAVGSTGWSTGPHLHFEVRVNGEPQNPTRWL